MSFPRYESYKDSGVEWLGEVPAHWNVIRLRFLCQIETGNADTADAIDDGEYPFFVRSSIIERINRCTHDCEAVLTAGDGVGVGKVFHHFEGKFCAHQRVYIFRDFREIKGKFFYHYMKELFLSVVSEGTAKSTVDSLRRPMIADFWITVPPLLEQQSIVTFLELETAKIDALIAEQQRLIELLKEKRQAVISHAVTKGLDPDAPMKDSGIEWLGKVPGHWRLLKLKSLASFTGGGTPSRDNLSFWGGNIPWISPKDMKVENIIEAEESITTDGLQNSTTNLLPAGQVLMVVRSGILKHTIPVAINEVSVALNQDMKALNFRPEECRNKFFLRWVQGLNDELLLAWAKQGVTVESIEHTYLAETVIPLPPVQEQAAVILFLDRETTKLDTLTTEAQRAINLLKERRSALISAAVTGKIDVRGFVDSLPTASPA